MRRFLPALILALPATYASADTVPPRAVGDPHVCVKYYHAWMAKDRLTGTTTVAFTVTADGATKDITIATSSGNHNLDAAAIECVATWRYAPETKDGAPVDAPWRANVVWGSKIAPNWSQPVPANE